MISIQKINNKSYIDSYDVILIYSLCQALFLCKICGQFDTLEPLPRCHLSVKKTVKYNTLNINISINQIFETEAIFVFFQSEYYLYYTRKDLDKTRLFHGGNPINRFNIATLLFLFQVRISNVYVVVFCGQ